MLWFDVQHFQKHEFDCDKNNVIMNLLWEAYNHFGLVWRYWLRRSEFFQMLISRAESQHKKLVGRYIGCPAERKKKERLARKITAALNQGYSFLCSNFYQPEKKKKKKWRHLNQVFAAKITRVM